MKKYIFLILMYLLSINTFAQIPIFIKIGVNNAKYNSSMYKSYTSPYFGVSTSYKINEKLNFIPELIYSIEGTKVPTGAYSEGGSYTQLIGMSDLIIKSNTLNIPLLFQYNLYKNIKLSSGIQLAYIFNTTESLSNTSTIKGFSRDITNSINKINCALPLDVNYLLQSFPISINVRYNYGLNNLYTSGEKINVLQFGINYKLVSSFTLKK